jgi:hypothetical protein
MLNKETVELIQQKVKEINKEKDIDKRCTLMIELKDEVVFKINDELDELFSYVNLKKPKLNLKDAEEL